MCLRRSHGVIAAGCVFWVLVVGTGLEAAPAHADTASVAAALPDPCDVPFVGGICDVPGAVIDWVTGVPGDIANSVIEAFAGWIASGVAGFLEQAGEAIFSGTEPQLTDTGDDGRTWFLEHYDKMALVAVGLFAPLFILAVLHGVLTQSGALVARAVANLPIAALGTAVAVVVVQALLAVTDNASRYVAGGLGADTENFLSGVTSALLQPSLVGQGAAGLFGVVLLALFMAFAAFVVWLELLVREAAIYLTVAFLPLGFATHIWPALSSWLRRLIEVIIALILSKLVIVASLSLAGAALANQEGFATLVGAAGMLLLAAFAPFALFKLIPIASMAAIASLEGQGRRGARAAVPRASTAFYAHQLATAHGRRRTSAGSAMSGSAPPAGGNGSPPPRPRPSGPRPPTGPASGGGPAVAGRAAAGTGAGPAGVAATAAQAAASRARQASQALSWSAGRGGPGGEEGTP